MGLIEQDSFDEDQCRALMTRTSYGRIALSLEALPVIVPVRYALSGEELFFVVDGGQLTKAIDGSVVALQSDGYDEDNSARWTVLAVGRARRISATGRGEDHVCASIPEQAHEALVSTGGRLPPELGSGSRTETAHVMHLQVKVLSGRWVEEL